MVEHERVGQGGLVAPEAELGGQDGFGPLASGRSDRQPGGQVGHPGSGQDGIEAPVDHPGGYVTSGVDGRPSPGPDRQASRSGG